jgi:hypothetical protein
MIGKGVALGLTCALAATSPACKSSDSGQSSCGRPTTATSAAGAPSTGFAGPAATGSAATGSAASSPAARPAPTPLEPDALAKALAARHVKPADVLLRQESSAVSWALVAAGRDATNDVNAMEVVRVRASETAALRIVLPARSASFADASYALEVRDLDGDGRADAALTVGWTRELKTKDACKGCYRTVTEQATQLYVLSGGAPELHPAFTHLTAYTTRGESSPEGNDQAPPGPDDIAYEWSIEGKPPVLKLRRTKSQIAPNRWLSELDLARDPLVSAGAGKEVPLALD